MSSNRGSDGLELSTEEGTVFRQTELYFLFHDGSFMNGVSIPKRNDLQETRNIPVGFVVIHFLVTDWGRVWNVC